MRLLQASFLIFLIAGCSSTAEQKKTLQQKIADQEVRTLTEIKSDAAILLESHPELTPATKDKIRQQIDVVIARHQDLKEKESKVINLLITESLTENESKKTQKNLKKELDEIYDAKEENILSLVFLISKMKFNNETSESFNQDVQMFFREFR